MNKRIVLAALLAALTIALYFLGLPSEEPPAEAPLERSEVLTPRTEPLPEPGTAKDQEAPEPTSTGVPRQDTDRKEAPIIEPAPPSAGVSEPSRPEMEEPLDGINPLQDVEEVRRMVRSFRDALGENPVGTNEEITRALTGGNLKQVKIPVSRGSSINETGELVDRWGTPYFFHQISANEMEVRSAGPDRRLWTDDDHLVK